MNNLTKIMQDFSPYDHNRDETYEINSLTPIDSPGIQRPLDDGDKLLLIIVNPKLIQHPSDSQVQTLLHDLELFRGDLEHDGYNPRIISADVYSGPRHQDGLTVLAIRKFFQVVRQSYPLFQGAIFIGPFPEAFLVRTYPWKKHAGFGDQRIVLNLTLYANSDYLEIWPEIIATRSEIVLCDLDGNWDDIYHQGKTKLPSLRAIEPQSTNAKHWADYGSTSIIDVHKDYFDAAWAKYELNTCNEEFEDFFHINDGQFRVSLDLGAEIPSLPGKYAVSTLEILDSRDLEVGKGDLKNSNPIATPKILVSRIDASHIAITPNPAYRGDNGESLLDANGIPQEIAARSVRWEQLHTLDPELERKLVIQYLERNHSHRMSSQESDIRTLAVAGPEFRKEDIVKAIFGPLWMYVGLNDPPDGASVSQYLSWLGRRALIYAITSHACESFFGLRDLTVDVESLKEQLGEIKRYSDQWPEAFWAVFAGGVNAPRLAKEATDEAMQKAIDAVEQESRDLDHFLGSKPERWYWDTKRMRLCPGWKDLKGEANASVHKALWVRVMQYPSTGGRFYITDGCDVNSCNYRVRYDDEGYAKGQLAESVLFYLRGLAVIGRAKEFNDFPMNIGEIFVRQRRRFGEVWSGYFDVERKDASLDNIQNGITRKRSYFWGMVGDWTLRVVYR